MPGSPAPVASLLALVPGPGGQVEVLLAPGPDARLGTARTRGAVQGRSDGAFAWICCEEGEGTLTVAGHAVEVRGRRGHGSVFDGPACSALVAPGDAFALDVPATIVWRSLAGWAGAVPRSEVLAPADVVEEWRGDGPTRRQVRTYVDRGPLIVGETVNPAGGWSSYPPHRHAHEEVYLYRFSHPAGFGVHVSYPPDGPHAGRATLLRDGAIERIRGDYHPVVAAPHTEMYYLWALAGDDETVDTRVDPAVAP